MVMNNISKLNKCSNCGACYNICPVNAIECNENEMFYKPIVNSDLCINCGLCVKVCPIKEKPLKGNVIEAIGGFHNDKKIISESSSGGAFHAIAKKIIDNGGIVFGAIFDDDYHSVVFKNTDEVDLKKIQKSKYVESLVGNSFKEIKRNLELGRMVLFCGTPCQVAGLIKYLSKNYSNLITCDFSCGGLPSHKVYQDYISDLESDYKSSVKNVDFRPKTFGWKTHAIKIDFENGKQYSKPAVFDPFYQGFIYKRLTIRDDCYKCDFSNHHVSDFILADYWLSDKLSELPNNDTGISLILINSEKAKKFFKTVKADFYSEQQDINLACYNIKSGYAKGEIILMHNEFVKHYVKNGYKNSKEKYLKQKKTDEFKNRMIFFLKKVLK